MTNPRLMVLATVLLSGIAVPALADWDRIGSVDVSYRNNHDVEYTNFGGRVEALALRAHKSDVTCRNVTATFGNGDRRDVFHGFLPMGRIVAVDLPGESRVIRRLDLNCRSMDRDGADVEIAADVGRYQAEWRRSPDWDRMWSRMFHWDDNRSGGYVTGQLDTSGWITVGRERFEGRGDHEMTFAGWRGRNVDTIALRPVNDDARCRSVIVTFANGDRTNLSIDNGDVLRQDRLKTFDLPGNRRDVTRVDMNCHAEHGNMVTMEVLASR
ncbi:MAG TPA: hypothetical protein VNH44_05930 [Micropepsaceae bacterium]|nr:hypothetical protein [Micropepsaceae bacterium]